MFKAADLALYAAKGAGRGGYQFFDQRMVLAAHSRRTIEMDLRLALSNQEFELHYQPLIALPNGTISGFEALIRWRHPDKGMIMPADFIPVAEDLGLIVPIGDWALKQACRHAMSWPNTLRLAVNLSPVQFASGSVEKSVERALGLSGLSAHRLELEVTESILLDQSEATLTALHRLRALGVRISMDDFGTGYSSLSYLTRFPFDKIKIDRSFVMNLGKSQDSEAIVRATIDIARHLKMSLTAEGVETAGQAALLKALGCNEVQGYFFSPPKAASETAGLIAKFSRPRRLSA